MKRFKGLKFLAMAIAAGTLVTPAWATLMLQYGTGITNNGTIITGGTICADGAACDSNGNPNVVTVDLVTLGTLTVSTVGGNSFAPMGVLSFFLNATASAGSGTFSFAITDTGFNTPAPPLILGASITGNSAPGGNGVTANLSAVGFFKAGAVPFGTDGTATSTAATMLGAAQGNGVSPLIASGNPYTLTDFVTVTLTGLGTSNDKTFQVGSSLASSTSVPEPTSVSLVGGALLLAAAALKRKFLRSQVL